MTVASKNANTFDVALIPHTIELTTFGNLAVGDSVNVEVDILGKYIENYMDVRKGNLKLLLLQLKKLRPVEWLLFSIMKIERTRVIW